MTCRHDVQEDTSSHLVVPKLRRYDFRGNFMLIGHKGMGDNMSALRLAKKELRRSIRQTISSLSDESINSQSSAVTNSILSLPEYQRARSLSVYLSMPKGEISTSLIVKDALKAGKHVFVPYVHKVAQAVPESPGSVMDMVTLHSLEDYETLEHDSWGIPTPSETSIGRRKCCLDHPETTDSEIKEPAEGNVELIIMPGMAFDRGLGRLGHGKGYYDFFLQRYHEKKIAIDNSNNHMPLLIGLALQEQLLPHDQKVPIAPTDWSLDALAVGDGTFLRR